MAITVIFGEMTRPVTCQSLRQCRGTYFHSISVLLTYSDITVLHLSVVRRIAERGSLFYTAFETTRMPVTPLVAEVTNERSCIRSWRAMGQLYPTCVYVFVTGSVK